MEKTTYTCDVCGLERTVSRGSDLRILHGNHSLGALRAPGEGHLCSVCVERLKNALVAVAEIFGFHE